MQRRLVFACCLLATISPGVAGGSPVGFDEAGTALVNGKPFFPIGLFTYDPQGPRESRQA